MKIQLWRLYSICLSIFFVITTRICNVIILKGFKGNLWLSSCLFLHYSMDFLRFKNFWLLQQNATISGSENLWYALYITNEGKTISLLDFLPKVFHSRFRSAADFFLPFTTCPMLSFSESYLPTDKHWINGFCYFWHRT